MTPPIAQNDASHKSAAGAAIVIASVGRSARKALTAISPGRVIAVFRRSFYVETAGGLACVGPPGLGRGPLNALCGLPATDDWHARGIAEGAVLDCSRRFDVGAADIWLPRPISDTPGRDGTGVRLRRLSEVARSYARSDGLAPLVADAGRSEGLVLRAARVAIDDLDSWLESGAAGEARPPPDSALNLLGLGPGLTPSGDDYIGGVLVALFSLGRTDCAAVLAARALSEAPRRTGRISAAHLVCAAEGEGAGALHDAIAAVLGASDRPVEECLAAIDTIGHSSGWDALAGAMAVLRAYAG